ncbi:hypothetical protein [Aquipuribacter sp. SD81]|uniref:hypothetical protein n=1 Tax=Aquipuribacter sp. SD81 TaxID=3127703 RepID=UPI003017B459
MTNDPEQMRDLLSLYLATGGWPAVREVYEAIFKADPAVPVQHVANVAHSTAEALVDATLQQLINIDRRAQQILADELALGLRQLRTAAVTFFQPNVLWPGGSLEDIRVLAKLDKHPFRRGITLREGTHLQAWKQLLVDLDPLNRAIDTAAEKYRPIENYAHVLVPEALVRYRTPVLKARAERAIRLHRDVTRWPLLAWLTWLPRDPQPLALVEAARTAIAVAARAWLTVVENSELRRRPGREKLEPNPETAERRWRFKRMHPAHLGPDPFARGAKGVWVYPRLIEQARRDLGLTRDAVVSHAVERATRSDVPLTFTALLFVLQIEIAIGSAGLAKLLGAMQSSWHLMAVMDKGDNERAAFRAILDPSRSLATEPSSIPAIGAAISMAGDLLPGWSGAVVGIGGFVTEQISGTGGP